MINFVIGNCVPTDGVSQREELYQYHIPVLLEFVYN